jgi:hypothetical protein
VVAGARGDDPPRAVIAERGELGQRSPELERPGALQVLGLERNGGPGAFAQRAGAEDRGLPDDPGAGLGGVANLVE